MSENTKPAPAGTVVSPNHSSSNSCSRLNCKTKDPGINSSSLLWTLRSSSFSSRSSVSVSQSRRLNTNSKHLSDFSQATTTHGTVPRSFLPPFSVHPSPPRASLPYTDPVTLSQKTLAILGTCIETSGARSQWSRSGPIILDAPPSVSYASPAGRARLAYSHAACVDPCGW